MGEHTIMNTEKGLIGLSGLWKAKSGGQEIKERSGVIVQEGDTRNSMKQI